MKTADEWINTCEYVHRSTFKECPFCERNALRADLSEWQIKAAARQEIIDTLRSEVERLKELLYGKLEDYNTEGKTILDFYAVWHRQDKDALIKAKSDLAAAVEIIKMFESLPCAIHKDDDVERHKAIRKTAHIFLT